MEREKSLSGSSGKIICEIPLRLPSLNDYVRACRSNAYVGAKMKKKVEQEISGYIEELPRFDRPVRISFRWTENNKRRDFDNIAFAKKFVLDALVKYGKLKDDNRRCVTGFVDSFDYGAAAKVTLVIEEE